MMKGRQKLRIAPVGELRPRWVKSVLETESNRVEGTGEIEGGEIKEVQWETMSTSLEERSDPLSGLQLGSKSRFWNEEDSEPATPVRDHPPSPSNASPCRQATEAGFLVQQIDEATGLLQVSGNRDKIMGSTTPATMDTPTTVARKIVSTLFKDPSKSAGVWKGPLPRPGVSPPLTLGDCQVNDRRGDFTSAITGNKSTVR